MSCSIGVMKRSGSISREQIPDLSGSGSDFRTSHVLPALKFYKPHSEVNTSRGLKDTLVLGHAQGWGPWPMVLRWKANILQCAGGMIIQRPEELAELSSGC